MRRTCRLVTRGAALVSLLVLVLDRPAMAQDGEGGTWFAFQAYGNPGSSDQLQRRWKWWFDTHARFFERDADNVGIVRPGVGYALTDRSTVWMGYALVRSFPQEAGPFNEQRFWQQYTWEERNGFKTLFAQTRLEQRFDDRGDDVGWRFRQFFRWTTPIVGDQPWNQDWSLRVWDELFFDLNETDWGQDPGLSENRFFAGFGFHPDPENDLTLEIGYLNQFLRREDVEDGMNHILGTTLLWTR